MSGGVSPYEISGVKVASGVQEANQDPETAPTAEADFAISGAKQGCKAIYGS